MRDTETDGNRTLTRRVNRLTVVLSVAIFAMGLSPREGAVQAAGEPSVVEAVDIEPVWAGHRVGFCLLTHGQHQFAAYYDAERRMSVAGRRLGETRWTIRELDSTLGWDSHNYVTMAIDREGHLHVSGNMHVKYGSGTWLLNPDTLGVVGTTTLPRRYPTELSRTTSKSPGLAVRWASDEPEDPNDAGRYVLRWESRGVNRDRPQPGPVPDPSMLTLYHFTDRLQGP